MRPYVSVCLFIIIIGIVIIINVVVTVISIIINYKLLRKYRPMVSRNSPLKVKSFTALKLL